MWWWWIGPVFSCSVLYDGEVVHYLSNIITSAGVQQYIAIQTKITVFVEW
jgi:hypothetical protein